MIIKQGTLTAATPELVFETDAPVFPAIVKQRSLVLKGLTLFNTSETQPATVKLHVVFAGNEVGSNTIYKAWVLPPYGTNDNSGLFTPALEIPAGNNKVYLELAAAGAVNYTFDGYH